MGNKTSGKEAFAGEGLISSWLHSLQLAFYLEELRVLGEVQNSWYSGMVYSLIFYILQVPIIGNQKIKNSQPNRNLKATQEMKKLLV